MFKIAVFADIHANYHALKAIMDDINDKMFDEVICLGDILSKGPNPKECMDLIIDNDIKMVFGNHEGKAQEIYAGIVESWEESSGNLVWCMKQLDERCRKFIMTLGYEYTFDIDGVRMQFTHYPFDHKNKKFFYHADLTKTVAEKYFRDYDYDYIFFGHHHYGRYLNLDGKKLYNLDSSGCVSDEYTFYYIITVDNGNVKVRKRKLKYDREGFVKAMLESSTPNKKHLCEEFFGINM